MDCPTEEALIRDRLGKLPGVTALDFNLMQRVLGVQHTLATSAPIEKALASIGMQAARQDMQTATTVLRIAKMDCPTEESLIRGKLQGMPGVQGMDFNLMQRTLTVRHTRRDQAGSRSHRIAGHGPRSRGLMSRAMPRWPRTRPIGGRWRFRALRRWPPKACTGSTTAIGRDRWHWFRSSPAASAPTRRAGSR
jgi:cation transport ATPase